MTTSRWSAVLFSPYRFGPGHGYEHRSSTWTPSAQYHPTTPTSCRARQSHFPPQFMSDHLCDPCRAMKSCRCWFFSIRFGVSWPLWEAKRVSASLVHRCRIDRFAVRHGFERTFGPRAGVLGAFANVGNTGSVRSTAISLVPCSTFRRDLRLGVLGGRHVGWGGGGARRDQHHQILRLSARIHS